ncbi:beta-ketoacyl synthase N-terminal-like domain-containing protein [Neisseria leonii]|uniref:Beta-ketoacyl synthase n=1 Tax=Neisseria leonii TaxID=2995413 RepID=A0A9X4E340_9NEIS|nr:beta-ketoacyl synthase N-terminal-like domain-containing protein [Neisseria sp. 51.81]MDD9327855.1 beta-ketoacyl synthase [Neisseria sp. 51.81]
MTYLCGWAATSALNPQGGRAPGQPETVGFTFLNQACRAGYYRAFGETALSRRAVAALAVQHLDRAARAAGWPSESWHDAAVFIGSSSYLMSAYENGHTGGGDGGHSLLHLARDLQAHSGNARIFSMATACTSSAHALIQAHNHLPAAANRRAFVLGFENFNRLTLLHFHSLNLLAGHYRPFGSDGLILGEGMAALALSAEKPAGSALRLAACAANTGSSPVQSDSGAQEALMRQVLAAAEADTVCAVKTHGVGTADSDTAEKQALHRIFGTLPPLLAYKPQTGHTLGAAAALETVLLAETLQRGEGRDHTGRHRRFSDGLYLSNHFGFGGSNTAAVWQWTR